MLKLLKKLMKYWKTLLLIIVLLVIQAFAELALPDYTSNIVNIGIQQGGVEDCVPEVIRQSTLETLLLAIDDDEYVLDKYTLISKENLNNQDYEKYLAQYPLLEDENLYIKNKLSKEDEEKLQDILAKPLIMVYFVNTSNLVNLMKDYLLDLVPEESVTQLQDKSVIEIVKTLPQEQIDNLIGLFDEQIDNRVGGILEQSAVTATRAEYEAIGIDMDKLQTDYIWKTGLEMAGVALIIAITAVLVILFSSKVACEFARDIREQVFEKILKYSDKEFNEFSTASLITRTTNDIQQVQSMVQLLFRTVIFAPIMGIGGLIRIIMKSNTSMVWIAGLALACIVIVMILIFIVVLPKFKKLQEYIDKINLVTREILTGLPVIRAFHKEQYEENKFDVANIDLTKVSLFVNRIMSLMMPLILFGMNGITLLIVWVGGHNIDDGIMQVGDMMATIQYMIHIITSFLMIAMIAVLLPRAVVSANRITEVLEKDLTIDDTKKAKKLDKNKKGLVEFKNVSFKYPDNNAETLKNINFIAEPGKVTAIVGGTGSGKSTLVNLIPRFYDTTNGKILVDGVDVKELRQKDLRNVIGFVPQKETLFSGTVESNIKFSNRNMSDEKMAEAARIAQATDFIETRPEKYKSKISQDGTNISGGQKQRISIARAIASEPEIYIFDDNFSALDYKTDCLLREELSKITKSKTVIIVAQRINTILSADKIIVLDNGEVVGNGTHDELLNSCELYRQIALSQLSTKELGIG